MFTVMRHAYWHQFQILTKRSDRLLELDLMIGWPDNVWMGVSVENTDYEFRIDHLRLTGAVTKFLSLEPLLGPLPNLRLNGVDWVIVGGESGPGCRRFVRNGLLRSEINAPKEVCPSSLSSGAGRIRKKPVGFWKVVPGTRCRPSVPYQTRRLLCSNQTYLHKVGLSRYLGGRCILSTHVLGRTFRYGTCHSDDGCHQVKAGLEKDKACLLVVIGAMSDAAKEVLALVSGYRASTEPWLEVLTDLRDRGLLTPS